MASRVLGAGGDHPTLKDWEAWVTNPANFGASANWDDPVNGGEQILRVANQEIVFTSPQVLDLDALVTATNYKVTIRPNYEGGVTSVGAKVVADGTFNAGTVDKTPRLVNSGFNHQFVLDISNTSTVEWYIEGLTIRPAHHRSGSIAFPANPTRNIYVDRCIVADRTPGGASVLMGGPQPSAVGRVYVRSCILDSSDDVSMLWNNASGVFLLGNTIRIGTLVNPVIHRSWGGQLPIHVYGNAIYYAADGYTAFDGANPWVASDFVAGYNVANIAGAAWTADFSDPSNVSGSTIAGMFVSSTNHHPKENGALHGVVTWSSLPAAIQAAWPDKDFLGATITKSGSFSAGAIYVPATSTVTGAGAITLRGIIAAALGAPMAAGSGAVALLPVAEAGVGAPLTQGQGSLSTAPASLSAAGTPAVEGQGAVAPAPLTAAGAGAPAVQGQGAAGVAALGLDADGTPATQGQGAGALARVEAAGSGSPIAEAVGAAALRRVSAAAIGSPVVAGQGSVPLAPLGLASSVVVELRGAGLVVVERLGGIGAGQAPIVGVGALGLRPVAISGSSASQEPDDNWEIVFDAETSMALSLPAEPSFEVVFAVEAGMTVTFGAEAGFEFVDQE